MGFFTQPVQHLICVLKPEAIHKLPKITFKPILWAFFYFKFQNNCRLYISIIYWISCLGSPVSSSYNFDFLPLFQWLLILFDVYLYILHIFFPGIFVNMVRCVWFICFFLLFFFMSVYIHVFCLNGGIHNKTKTCFCFRQAVSQWLTCMFDLYKSHQVFGVCEQSGCCHWNRKTITHHCW